MFFIIAFKIQYYIILPLWIVAGVVVSIWTYKAKPDKGIIEKYPTKIIKQLQRPFGKSWMQHVDKADIGVLQTYQYRIRLLCLLGIIPPLLSLLWVWLGYLLVKFHYI
jgi:hypothetical protein